MVKKQYKGRGTPNNRKSGSTSGAALYEMQDNYSRDGTESLTYSINSNSVGSSMGESCDSSQFGEFLKKVLNETSDLTDKELALMEDVTGGSKQSSAMAAYHAGQHTDSRLDDGGYYNERSDEQSNSVMFAPAQHAGSKSAAQNSRKKKQRQNHRHEQTKGLSTSPSPPPPSPSSRTMTNEIERELPPKSPHRANNEIWYTQWWMCGFSDSLGL
mmetsp:Transcript_2082/g.2791  ORF Transcript_2082/g.2791 Transcript_2082/m.2791 type:complete len:214 (+) Transcript_2082:381-1022(+)